MLFAELENNWRRKSQPTVRFVGDAVELKGHSAAGRHLVAAGGPGARLFGAHPQHPV